MNKKRLYPFFSRWKSIDKEEAQHKIVVRERTNGLMKGEIIHEMS